jgi:hypothetical protein
MAHIFPCHSESKDNAEAQQKVVVTEVHPGAVQFADYMKSSRIFMFAIEQKRSILGRPLLAIPVRVPHAPKPYFGMHLGDRMGAPLPAPRGFLANVEMCVQPRCACRHKGFGFSRENAMNFGKVSKVDHEML